MKSRLNISAIAVLAMCMGISLLDKAALAHHSFAMFDMSEEHTLKGTVRNFEWSNPHTWLWVYVDEVDGKPVPQENGRPQIWGLEGTAPGELKRMDPEWNPKRLKPGDKITVLTHLLKDGRHGGGMGQITFDDGRIIGRKVFGGEPPATQTSPANTQ